MGLATKRALQHASRLKRPSRKQLESVAFKYGIHVATLYRALKNGS